MADALKFQQYLNDQLGHGEIRIVVFCHERQNRIIFKGEAPGAKFNLCVYLEKNHYSFLGKPSQLFRVNLFINF